MSFCFTLYFIWFSYCSWFDCWFRYCHFSYIHLKFHALVPYDDMYCIRFYVMWIIFFLRKKSYLEDKTKKKKQSITWVELLYYKKWKKKKMFSNMWNKGIISIHILLVIRINKHIFESIVRNEKKNFKWHMFTIGWCQWENK